MFFGGACETDLIVTRLAGVGVGVCGRAAEPRQSSLSKVAMTRVAGGNHPVGENERLMQFACNCLLERDIGGRDR